jgi:serine O-acetyltransferase
MDEHLRENGAAPSNADLPPDAASGTGEHLAAKGNPPRAGLPDFSAFVTPPVASASAPHGRSAEVERIVEELCSPVAWRLDSFGKRYRTMLLPSRHKVLECAEELRSVMFPGYFGYREFRDDTLRFHVGATLDRVMYTLQNEICIALQFIDGWHYEREYAQAGQAGEIVDTLLSRLPAIRQRLVLDAQACFEWDPASFIPEAPIFCYPNILAMINYRLAHELYLLGVPFIPRIITEHAHSLTGIDIHPGAQIGDSFFIDHGTGVVIGQTCIVGQNVRLYQGVTLGAKSFPIDPRTDRPQKGLPRHPIIEDDVVIFAEATILGRVTIGKGSVIGANVFLARSVPPYSRVFSAPVRISEARPEDDAVGGG